MQTRRRWKFLKSKLPKSFEDHGGSGNDFIYNIYPNAKPIITWSPICRHDVSWNFKKFLMNQDNKPAKQCIPTFENMIIVPDIDALLADPNAAV